MCWLKLKVSFFVSKLANFKSISGSQSNVFGSMQVFSLSLELDLELFTAVVVLK